jgi:hypothetical protein
MLIGYARVSTTSRTTDLQADTVAGCKQDPPTRPAGTKAERRVPGARFERWERSHRARSVCGSHDPVSNGQGGHNYFGGSGPDRNQWVSVKWLPPEWLGSRMDRS